MSRDTDPCPPPDTVGFFVGPDGEPVTFAQAKASFQSMQFPGGPIAISKPTRADLLLSCRQWSDAVRDAIVDCEEDGRVLAKLERLNAVLAELKEMG